jgi:hypothetical protein
MKLTAIARQHVETLYGKHADAISRQYQAEVEKTIRQFASRGIAGGMADMAEAKIHVERLEKLAQARVDCFIAAYEKSGVKLEEEDIEEIIGEIREMQSSGFRTLISGRKFTPFNNFLQAERDRVVAEVRRDLLLKVQETKLSQERDRSYINRPLHDIFERDYERVAKSLRSVDPALDEQIREAADRLSKGTSEALSHAALTCRRMLKVFADRVYPPTNEVATGRKLDDSHFINRLWQYAGKKLQDKTTKNLVQGELDDIGQRLDHLNELASKGVHTDRFASQEAERCLIQTIFVLAELADM